MAVGDGSASGVPDGIAPAVSLSVYNIIYWFVKLAFICR